MIAKLIGRVGAFDLEKLLAGDAFFGNKERRMLFLALLALNVFAFFIFVAHHPIHNHGLRSPWMHPNEQVYLGRWFNIFVMRLIHHSDMPVFLPVLSMVIGIVSGMLLVRHWRVELTFLEKFIVIGMLTTFPFWLASYYYTWLTPLHFFALLFAVLGVAYCRRFRALDIAVGAICVMLMMASYQPAISAFATIAALSIIMDLSRFTASGAPAVSLLEIAKTNAARVISAAVGGALYLLSLRVLNIKQSHATATIELADLPEKFRAVAKASFDHLLMSQPELLEPMKLLLLAVLAVAALCSFVAARRSFLRIAIIGGLWLGAIVATKTMYLISADTSYFQYRYNPGLTCLYMFAAAYTFHTLSLNPARNVALLAFGFILLRFVQADLIRQEVIMRGQEHDFAIANRILTRVENLEGIDFSKTYDFVRVGVYSKYREELLKSKGHTYRIYGEGHMDYGEVSARWVDEEVMRLIGSKIKFKHQGMDVDFYQKELDARARFKAEGRQPWPHRDSVFIEDDVIYVYMR